MLFTFKKKKNDISCELSAKQKFYDHNMKCQDFFLKTKKKKKKQEKKRSATNIAWPLKVNKINICSTYRRLINIYLGAVWSWSTLIVLRSDKDADKVPGLKIVYVTGKSGFIGKGK